MNIPYSLYLAPPGGLFISGPFKGGAYWRGGLIERGGGLFIHQKKNNGGDYLFELQ